jgi:hypothetical protein
MLRRSESSAEMSAPGAADLAVPVRDAVKPRAQL